MSETQINPIPTGRKKQRSPGYPGIGLQQALERAKDLHRKERRNYAPVSVILKHWGYQPKSGGGLVVLAALKKFGLLEDEGSGPNRKARLTDLAFKIIADERPNSSERKELIKQAALAPSIHQELWEKYGGDLPSPEALEYELRTQRAFTDHAAKEFIQEFRETIDFAGLDKSGNISARPRDKKHEDQQSPASRGEAGSGGWVPPMSEGHVVSIPIGLGTWAMLQAPFPLTEVGWKQMMTVLEAMKPALVTEQGHQQQAPVGESTTDDEE